MSTLRRVTALGIVGLAIYWLASSRGQRSRYASRSQHAPSPATDFEARLAAQDPGSAAPHAADFELALDAVLETAREAGASQIDLTAGELHRLVGGYPGPGDRMPTCCSVMRRRLQKGDLVLEDPPRGVGDSLKLRYRLQEA